MQTRPRLKSQTLQQTLATYNNETLNVVVFESRQLELQIVVLRQPQTGNETIQSRVTCTTRLRHDYKCAIKVVRTMIRAHARIVDICYASILEFGVSRWYQNQNQNVNV